MIIKSADLETVCGITSRLPDNALAEIAFAGKSNVGKSSLINGLLNRKSLARTSSSPGKTQTINFYRVEATNMTNAQREASQNSDGAKHVSVYFVDLPGYGYAKASASSREQWGRLIEKYLHTSKQLRTVFLPVDIRNDPGENDVMMYDWIVSSGYRPVIIATKADKIKRSQIQSRLKAIREKLKVQPGSVLIPFSAVTKQGRDEIWEYICGTAQPENESGA